MIKKIAPKIMAGALAVMTLATVVQPIAVNAALSSQLGTRAALGSPLINENFSLDDYQKYEMLCFGVFLSNFVTPFVDDYKSAFATGQGGSDGFGRDALQFAAGNDSAANQALQGMLDYAINAQAKMREITVQYTYGWSKDVEGTADQGGRMAMSAKKQTPRAANIWDLQMQYREKGTTESVSGEDKHELQDEDYNFLRPYLDASKADSITAATEMDEFKLTPPEIWALPTFYVKGNDGTTDIVVFDLNDAWDMQVLALWMVKTYTSNFMDKADENQKNMTNQKSRLYLDTFGNIVADYNGRNIIIIPAAANQHLTKSPTINLLNSVVLNGMYTNQSLQGLMENAHPAGFSAFDQAFDTSISGDVISIKGADRGDFYLCFDTDSYVFGVWDKESEKTAKRKYKAEKMNMGEAIAKLSQAEMNRNGTGFALKANISGWSANSTIDWPIGWKPNDSFKAMVCYSVIAAQIFGNLLPMPGSATVVDYMHTNVSEKDPIFGSHGYIVVSEAEGKKNCWSDILINSVLSYIDGSQTHVAAGVVGMPGQAELRNALLTGNVPNGDGVTGGLVGNNARQRLISYLMTDKATNKVQDMQGRDADVKWTIGTLFQNALLSQTVVPLKIKTAAEIGKEKATQLVKVADVKKLDGSEGGWDLTIDWGDNGYRRMKNAAGRVQKVFIPNQNMKAAENVLTLREGTQFAAWTPWIYITYLEVYGIKGDSSNFDSRIFGPAMDILNIDPDSILNGIYLSEEEKQKSINDYTYLMLHPTAGRKYRSGILLDWISDLVYNSYVSIVYGENVYNYAGGLGSTSSSGFLRFNNYEDNMFTGWLIQGYIQSAVMIVGVGVLAIMLVAIIMKKGIAWLLLSVVMLVNIVLLMPSTGDLVPTLASNMVQSIFTNNMTFWTMSESIANQALEAQYVSQAKNSGTGIDASAVKAYVKQLNTVELDRTLMIKQDISKKLVENATGIMNIVQQNASTRWLLPRLMTQFNSDDGRQDYVFTTLGAMYDNWSSMYWIYNPNDRNNVTTIDAAELASTEASNTWGYGVSRANWMDYVATGATNIYEGTGEANALYDSNTIQSILPGDTSVRVHGETVWVHSMYPDSTGSGWASPYLMQDSRYETWNSISRLSFEDWMGTADIPGAHPAHTCFYQIPDLSVPAKKNMYNSSEFQTWEEFAELWGNEAAVYVDVGWGTVDPGAVKASFQNTLVRLVSEAANYNPREIGALPDFGFLWMTENPGSYFYQVVKESFAEDNASFAQLVGDIQGHYVESSLTGMDERVSAMHFSNTGEVRDILDLQELFTNVVPYMASVQYVACGTNGTNGVFGEAKLDGYHIYEDNYASWLFRSNWITKLVENEVLTKPCTVKYNGVEYRIQDPLDPRSYPKERPMVFSDAQKYVWGLTDGDLTEVELKCCQLNKAVERRWTLLLNYVNTSGMTAEVMYRQMALAALLEFNKEFSDTGLQTSATKLYPTSVDLRYLSFDSVMRMLMINSSGNAAYIYGDTMRGVIENSDILSAILLLLGAFLCQTVIPLARDILLALVFYLGLWSVLCNIFAGGRAKLKTCAGFAISNLVYLIMTLLYYAVFGMLMQLSSADEVLSTSRMTVDNGPPTVSFLIIIAASLLYIYGTWKMLMFVVKNYKDLGFEVYAAWSEALAGKISNSVDSLKDHVGSRGESGGGAGAVGAAATGAAAGAAAGAVAGAAGATAMTGGSSGGGSTGGGDDAEAGAWDEEDDAYTQSGHATDYDSDSGSREGRSDDFDIDRAVERGREGRRQGDDATSAGGRDEVGPEPSSDSTTSSGDE